MWSLYKDPDGKSVFEEEKYNHGVHGASNLVSN